jgi:predicted acylesterase/phospholipase RssA
MPDRSHAPRRRQLLRAAALLPLGTTAACAIPERIAAVPRERTLRATVLGLPNERFHIRFQEGREALEREFAEATGRQRARLGIRPADPLPVLDLLAVSGGGEDGAFGAGLLNGWTAHGTRPTFELVTGVSTGALTAPFAFLGAEWDEELRKVYTDISPERVAIRRWLTAALFDDGLADTAPLFRTIEQYLNDRMIGAIARAHRDGRLLLVATADIDAQTPVIWNIGGLAASGHPGSTEIIRRVLLASAAIPGAFPPVMFDVTVDGQRHQEMHVDGGTFTQAFLYPSTVTRQRRQNLARGRRVSPARAWVIRNGRLDAQWQAMERRTVSIAARAVATMTSVSGWNDAVRMYFSTQRDGMDFNLAFIGPGFTREYREPFEQAYMQALYDYALARAARGFDWVSVPPQL